MPILVEDKIRLHLEYLNIQREVDDVRQLIYELTTPGAVERARLDPRKYPSPQELEQTYKKKLQEEYNFEEMVVRRGGREMLQDITDRDKMLQLFSQYLLKERDKLTPDFLAQIYQSRTGFIGTPWIWDPELQKVLQKYAGRLNGLIELSVDLKVVKYGEIDYKFKIVKTTVKPPNALLFVVLQSKLTDEMRIFYSLGDLVQEMVSRWVHEKNPPEKGWYDKYIVRKWEGAVWYQKWRKFLREYMPEWEMLFHAYHLIKVVGYGRWTPDIVSFKRNINQRRYWATLIRSLWFYKDDYKNQKPYDHLIPYAPDWQPTKFSYEFFYVDPNTAISKKEVDFADKILAGKPRKLKRKPVPKKTTEDFFLEAKTEVRTSIENIIEDLKSLNVDITMGISSILWGYYNYIEDIYKKYQKTEFIGDLVDAWNILNNFKYYMNNIKSLITQVGLEKIDKGRMLTELFKNLIVAEKVIKEEKKRKEIHKKIEHVLTHPVKL